MKTLTYRVTVENIPDTVNHEYRIQGALCTGATEQLRRSFGEGVNVIVFDPEAIQPNSTASSKSRFKTFYLSFDPQDGSGGRWQRGDYGLHCGDGLEVRINGEWVQTRVEHSSFSKHSHGWYLVTHPNKELEGLAVRKEDA